MASAGLRAHIGVWGRAPVGMLLVGSQEAKPPEAESSLAFEASVAKFDTRRRFVFTAQYTIVQSAVLLSACRLSVRPSVRL